jgi:hypothetical protein
MLRLSRDFGKREKFAAVRRETQKVKRRHANEAKQSKALAWAKAWIASSLCSRAQTLRACHRQ